MNKTSIYVSRKLEKTIGELPMDQHQMNNQHFEKWVANMFLVDRKKCWILIHKSTKYLLVLPDIKKSDLKEIDQIFQETLFSQLICDGIVIDYKLLNKVFGEIELYQTDNDKSANGSLNEAIQYFKDWKKEFGSFQNMPFRDLNSRLNGLPSKTIGWKFPKEKMKELLQAYA